MRLILHLTAFAKHYWPLLTAAYFLTGFVGYYIEKKIHDLNPEYGFWGDLFCAFMSGLIGNLILIFGGIFFLVFKFRDRTGIYIDVTGWLGTAVFGYAMVFSLVHFKVDSSNGNFFLCLFCLFGLWIFARSSLSNLRLVPGNVE